MTTNHKIIQSIFDAIDHVNEHLSTELHLEKSLDTALFGRSGNLDSLALVNLIVAVEQNIEDQCGIALVLADSKAVSQEPSPFTTIGTLADYIASLVGEKESA